MPAPIHMATGTLATGSHPSEPGSQGVLPSFATSQQTPYSSQHSHSLAYQHAQAAQHQPHQHQQVRSQSMSNNFAPYLSPSSYSHFHQPSSPPANIQQFPQGMNEMEPQVPYAGLRTMSGDVSTTASGPDLSARAVSPVNNQHEAQADPYFMPFIPSSNGPVGQQYYAPGSGHAGFPQSQYDSTPYGMQYYPSYTQTTFYNPRPHGWVPAPQQGWRPSPFYPYTGPAMSSHQRPTSGGRPRPPPAQGAQRSASSSSRTSPASIPTSSQKVTTPFSVTPPSNITPPNGGRSGAARASRTAYQSLQGQGPRSDHVLWCGNVPADANVDELWMFFSKLPLEEEDVGDRLGSSQEAGTSSAASMTDGDLSDAVPAHGVLSIFIISRSNCAFVNYASAEHLQRALSYFQGQPLRPHDPRCPKLVCRVRKKDDEAQAGVAGQRGRGIHVAWLKEQERKTKGEQPAQVEHDRPLVAPQARRMARGMNLEKGTTGGSTSSIGPSPESSAATPKPQSPQKNVVSSSQGRPSIDESSGSGSVSYASTNSSLFRHPAFRERFFILKSLRIEDLEQSVQNGTWATQPHNEPVLDQAYRNSENVYLIFSANQSGGFYGYARMAGPIGSHSDRSNTIRPTSIPEHDESGGDASMIASQGGGEGHSLTVLPQSSEGLVTAAISSPQQLTPSTDEGEVAKSLSASPSSRAPDTEKESDTGLRSKDTLASAPAGERVGQISPPGNLGKSAAAPPVTVTAPVSQLSKHGTSDTFTIPRELPEQTTIMVVSPSHEELDPFTQRSAEPESVSLGSTSSEPWRKEQAMQSISYRDTPSIAPSESASYPADARTQSQLAIRALIHNLRLDERESVHRAKQLEAVEAEIKAQESQGAPTEALETVSTAMKPQALASSPETWGKPFKVEWIKVTPLSFSQVRKLRNPWRDNRQVKVSRDGTELEPNVGRQVLELWNKPEPSSSEPIGQSSITSSAVDDEDEDEDV